MYNIVSHPAAAGQEITVNGSMVDVIGIPHLYTAAELQSSELALFCVDKEGWYALICVCAPPGTVPTRAGYAAWQGRELRGEAFVAAAPRDRLHLAVRLGGDPGTHKIAVSFDGVSRCEFYVRALDLSVRNLNYATTYYVIDMDRYTAYTWRQPAVFREGRAYYTRSEDGYLPAVHPTAEDLPEYWEHAAMRVEGYPKNLSYKLRVDCPVTLVMPAVDSDANGSWIEMQCDFDAPHSMQIETPPGVLVSGEGLRGRRGYMLLDIHYHPLIPKWHVHGTLIVGAGERNFAMTPSAVGRINGRTGQLEACPTSDFFGDYAGVSTLFLAEWYMEHPEVMASHGWKRIVREKPVRLAEGQAVRYGYTQDADTIWRHTEILAAKDLTDDERLIMHSEQILRGKLSCDTITNSYELERDMWD